MAAINPETPPRIGWRILYLLLAFWLVVCIAGLWWLTNTFS